MYAIDRGPLPVRADAVDVVLRDAVVELLLVLVGEVAQAVPLRRHLRVEGPDVVVDDARVLPD